MEWIVLADNPTRAMERYKAGDIVRCKDCRHSVTDGIQVMCNHFAMGYWDVEQEADIVMRAPVEADGYCAWGERRT